VQRIVFRHVTDATPHVGRLRKNIKSRHPHRPGGGRHEARQIRMIVLLPAPFCPSKPTISPRSTRNETPATATVPAYRLVRSSTSIMGSYRMSDGNF